MPIPIKSYACQYRCGKKSDTKQSRIVLHEASCIKNPATHSCPTCQYDKQSISMELSGFWGGEAEYDKRVVHRWCVVDGREAKTFISECPLWERKG